MTDFGSLDDYLDTPRLAGLCLSADGERLFATVSRLSTDGSSFRSSIWELDPAGEGAARRLTRSAPGESALAALPGGELLFASKRPSGEDGNGGADGAEGDTLALWALPPSGEPRRLASRPGGVTKVTVARDSGDIVIAAPTLPAATDAEADAAARTARKEADVHAVLHESSPVRFWDHDLGPDQVRLFAASPVPAHGDTGDTDEPLALRDLTPTPGRALDDMDEGGPSLSPDGSVVVTAWAVSDAPGFVRKALVAIDVATGDQRTLASEPHVNVGDVQVSPDGRWVAYRRMVEGTYDDPTTATLWLQPLDGGAGRDLLPGQELWPAAIAWAHDSQAVFFVADQNGRAPLFRVEVESGDLTRISGEGHHSAVCVDPRGRAVYALRDRIDCPPRAVRLDPRAADQDPTELPAPGETAVPGRLTEVDTTVADGTRIRGWLALPERSDPAPLLLWIHGGPLGSWNSWSWRWNPWLMVARGYAVLMPDPALSTGYGATMIRRGWGQWGGAPYDDLMALTDVVVERPEIDETRTAAMGGSYGGYMANWVAGHTDRFRCVVTHASLWALDQFAGTTDVPAYWFAEFGDPDKQPDRYREFSPHRHLDKITTPMLVIHGDKDYRVPIGEGLRLWWDLQRKGVESKFLYFPDENHWVLKPGDAKVWYQTVLAWLDHHVLGEAWRQPDLI